jgi:hypothetical protein
MVTLTLVVLALILLLDCTTAIATRRFESWYWFNDEFTNIIHQNCTLEYNYYRYHDLGNHSTSSNSYYAAPSPGHVATPLVSCLLEHCSELSKADMSAAGVLLGLTPTILAVAGSSLDETALLASRRPLLGLLVGMGSPAVAIWRTFQYDDVIGMLGAREVKRGLTIRIERGTGAAMHQSLVALAEYSLAIAAIANCILTSFDLSIKATVAWSREDWWNPLRWCVLPGVIHLMGVWSFWLDVEMVRLDTEGKVTIRDRLQAWARDEFRPCVSHGMTTFRYKPTTYGFLIVSWWAAILTLAHYIYGTA